MKRHIIRALAMVVIAVLLAVPASAGWKYVYFDMYTAAGAVNYPVNFWLNWDKYDSHFTMYKNINSMRVYVTVFNASYDAFKQQTANWNADDADPPAAGNPSANVGSPGTISWTDEELSDGGANDDIITFYMWGADFFRDVYGKPLGVSVLIAPHPDRKVGLNPIVEVTVNNANIYNVKVVYPRQAVRGIDIPDIAGSLGTVCVQDGDPALKAGEFTHEPMGHIGTIQVGGGILGGAGFTTTGYEGILNLISRARRIKKFNILQGGTMDKTIASGGRIIRVYTDNGLGTPVGKPGVKVATTPLIGAGWQINYDDDGASVARPWGINRVVMKRGGNNARVTAGSDPTAATVAGWAFQGIIKKLRCDDKGGGANAGLNGCTFVTLGIPKKTGSAVITGCTVETPNESIDLNTL